MKGNDKSIAMEDEVRVPASPSRPDPRQPGQLIDSIGFSQ